MTGDGNYSTVGLWGFFFTSLRNLTGVLSILSSCKDGSGVPGSIAG